MLQSKVSPADLEMMERVVETHCAAKRIVKDSVDHANAVRKIQFIFNAGVTDPNLLLAVLSQNHRDDDFA